MDLSNVKWRKSSHSGSNSGDCVELARLVGAVAVRDSKDPDGAVLLVAAASLRAAIQAAAPATA
ncbi:DUF397 domain-containing protein [Actinomadura soli]|uniref:DUF397 domain-containing protein n=1 Tax=Actinomadura soli TaxID=2508997 RepID=A0A5C4JJ90_9ACTN|nr:DUF397 domain-containing protein [Actinomadura soli]TMR07048.1 DUF397 domain-containing protein [Actinomadura soli]